MVLRNASQDVDPARPHDECPTCHRPWHGSSSQSHVSDFPGDSESQPSFINAEYFRMLQHSLPGSAESSAPPSPRRRLVQPVRSNGHTHRTATPPGAEFVGSTPAESAHSPGISAHAFAPKYFEKFFTVEGELGRGGHGVVLLVRHVLDRVPLGLFACKQVPIGNDHKWLTKVLTEVQLLQNLS